MEKGADSGESEGVVAVLVESSTAGDSTSSSWTLKPKSFKRVVVLLVGLG